MYEFLRGYTTGFAKSRQQRPAASAPYSFSFLSSTERRDIEEHLEGGRPFVLFFFQIKNYLIFSNLFGADITDSILEAMIAETRTILRQAVPGADFVHAEAMDEGRIMALCSLSGPPGGDWLTDVTASARLKIKTGIKQLTLKMTGQTLDIGAGFALVSTLGAQGLEHSLFEALCEAQHVAKGELDTSKLSLLKEFREVVSVPRLGVAYQPIMDLRAGDVTAWEALTRGPADSPFAMPTMLFDFAEEVGQLFTLEKVCREAAISKLGDIDPSQKLFINIHPRTLVDPSFSPGETLKLLDVCGLGPSNVVFEITERHSIRDFTLFHRTLEHYRSQGFLVAVDDVGTGYSGLWSIAELRPDFIKVDMSLIRDIDKNPVKRALIETFVAFADKIGCHLIAEGIETETELTCLMGIGVNHGQGYFLGRPDYPKPRPDAALPLCLGSRGLGGNNDLKCSIPVRKMAEKAFSVMPDTRVSRVKDFLRGNDPITAIVVADDSKRPMGLIMSHHLDRALSTRYGMSLYYHREATRIMDGNPLVVDQAEPVEKVAKMAMNREKYKIYDHIVVTDQGQLSGIVSVQKILDTLAAVQVEMAKGANPLSGLPGNVSIEQELERRCGSGDPFSIIYADLDNFKIYNDIYGFKAGDNVIMLISRIMDWACKRHGHPGQDFVGHVGGDDLVAICHPDRAERVCKAVTRVFKRVIPTCYSPEDRKRGHITAKSRSGQWEDFPLVSVSLAIVDCAGQCDLAAIGGRAAEMKKYAKSLPGNSYARDRRAPVGEEGKTGG
ncbi:GGDEF domain-containing protein [Desulfohalovibrio reitneri]|uniref:GGDEF domain-containing protein n=1 Tax=Desulfohalovibrio reitneri TaxID=1307759 RepID=UPI00068BFD83|nr:GGDEF domain-containing protein [Desulfohalovibrio reitneri]